jgi:hypothetical protein
MPNPTMPTPITLNPAPYQLRGQLTADQVKALVTLISGANLISLPSTANWANATGLIVTVLPNGTGTLSVNFKA